VKATEILAAKGFGFQSESDWADSLITVWKNYPMSYEDFINLPLPTFFAMGEALKKQYDTERREMDKMKSRRR